MIKEKYRVKKGEFDDIIVDYRDSYYDLVENVLQFMSDAEDGHYGQDEATIDEILYRMHVYIESSFRATPPKDLG